MGWFEEQLDERREADTKALEESFQKLAGVVLGQKMAQRLGDARIVTKQALDEVLKYYHLKPVEVPDNVRSVDDQMDYCLRHYGMMRRNVELTEGWYKDSYGPFIGFKRKGGTPVALLPNAIYGYHYIDPETRERVSVNKKISDLFELEAICFYKPMPQRTLSITDLLIYMKSCISMNDIVLILISAFAISLVGLLIPRITAAITGPVLSSGKTTALIGAAIFILCISLSSQLITTVNGLLSHRLEIKISLSVESSMMMRIMSLPVSFFREYSPGELKNRSMSVGDLCNILQGMIFTTGLTSLSSLLYITQIFAFAPSLVVPSIIIIIITMGFSLLTTVLQMGVSRRLRETSAKESGVSYSMISGIQKIKLAGAEKRMFARWLNVYSEVAELTYNPPIYLKISGVITIGINLFSTIVLYYMAIQSGVDQSSYFAFTAAYGTVMGAFMSLSGIAISVAQIKPILEMARPFLRTAPETAENKEIVTNISGRVELDHVSFKYSENGPYILNDLSLKIKSGEYVAIVGRTGCGKSTLIRLLLGFEKPEKGAVYYDSRDINTLDAGSLRRNIGTVTQDGGLFQGDIYSNITITAPYLTVDDAWEAAEKACIADDIRDMPMGMYTLISEGQGGISGGQRQRLMIARAIAPKPKLLIFDEATSALDNKTQRQVSEALDAMGCTRIVVAHRLSTIRHCDRIVVLDGGSIIEDGTYEELIDKKGYFAELVERQRLDNAG
ncbi:NHLM bacteriocin system ABC transporter, ATP-binding protein [Lachnospiraceae bacterium NE2001]|nr:NHLM bacteriocin system ABC transporter, ATP-binding protein [Lachnospiraceae bacterium NE2001]